MTTGPRSAGETDARDVDNPKAALAAWFQEQLDRRAANTDPLTDAIATALRDHCVSEYPAMTDWAESTPIFWWPQAEDVARHLREQRITLIPDDGSRIAGPELLADLTAVQRLFDAAQAVFDELTATADDLLNTEGDFIDAWSDLSESGAINRLRAFVAREDGE